MSTRSDIEDLLQKYSFGGMLKDCNAQLSLDPDESTFRRGGLVWVLFRFEASERYSGEKISIQTRFAVRHGSDLEDIHREVFGAIASRVAHEIGESIQFESRTIFDPHDAPYAWPWAISPTGE